MNCPRDDATLEKKTVHNASVDACPQCAGMYLHHGDLNRIAPPTHGDLEFSTVDLDTFEHSDDHGAFSCPNDGTTMNKVDFNIDTDIVLDYCKTCRGFWLDADELTRIDEEVRSLNEAEAALPDPLLVRISRFFWDVPVR